MQLLTTALLLTLSTTLQITPSIAQNTGQECRSYILISIRGTSEPQGPSNAFKGMINTTLSTLPSGSEYDVKYPASLDLTANLGAEDMNEFINGGLESCPDQNYAILGYSQGASAASLGLKSYLDPMSPGYQKIKAVLVVGNPGHLSGQMANVDQFGGDSTRDYNGTFLFDGALAIPSLFYDNEKVLDVCWQGDLICCPAYPNASFLPNHVLYGDDEGVQRMGAEFMIGKLRESDNASSTATTTAATASSPTAGPTTANGPSSTSAAPIASSTSTGAATAATFSVPWSSTTFLIFGGIYYVVGL